VCFQSDSEAKQVAEHREGTSGVHRHVIRIETSMGKSCQVWDQV
jgi:hypothetical protein